MYIKSNPKKAGFLLTEYIPVVTRFVFSSLCTPALQFSFICTTAKIKALTPNAVIITPIILNAMYVYVINIYNEVAGKSYDTEAISGAIKREFYVEERGLYKISDKLELIGQLGNSLAVLAGLGDDEMLEKLIRCEDMTPATLSMKPFLYDALLTAGDKYHDFILNDIKTVYKRMLDYGATSFWETELGWEDFDKAGSLCHGWSASPVYYLSVLGYVKDE